MHDCTDKASFEQQSSISVNSEISWACRFPISKCSVLPMTWHWSFLGVLVRTNSARACSKAAGCAKSCLKVSRNNHWLTHILRLLFISYLCLLSMRVVSQKRSLDPAMQSISRLHELSFALVP